MLTEDVHEIVLPKPKLIEDIDNECGDRVRSCESHRVAIEIAGEILGDTWPRLIEDNESFSSSVSWTSND